MGNKDRRGGMSRTYVYEDVWTMMCVWEEMLERQREHHPDEPTLLGMYWESVGSGQVRDDTIRRIAPWVDEIWTELKNEVGDDAHEAIGLHGFDWNFVPACISKIEWQMDGFTLPDVKRVTAMLIAEHVLS